jgi:hypothetical protein
MYFCPRWEGGSERWWTAALLVVEVEEKYLT